MTHLAAWTQSEKLYILLPLASHNLRTFMRVESGPELASEFVVWFLTQLKGLACALQHLHQSPPARIGLIDGSASHAPASIMAGYHHDLKPENILVFRDHKGDRGNFKISDFGSAKLGQLQGGVFGGSKGSATRASAHSGGALTYEAPDYVLNKKASRPADMWSLGCIFLELLLWTFSAGKSGINDEFALKRLQGHAETQYVVTDTFWHRGEVGVVRLRSAVAEAIDGLRKASRGRRAFEDLVACIEDLLIVEAVKRLTAIGLTQRLDIIFAQARADLKENPNCYLHENSTTTLRRPSMDTRSVETSHTKLGRLPDAFPNYDLGLLLGVPPQINDFIGREPELEQLHTWLLPRPHHQNVAVVYGLGGLGKTQLSVQFARQFSQLYSSVIWLNAKDQSTVKAGLAELAREVGNNSSTTAQAAQVAQNAKQEEELLVRQARRWLSRPDNDQWLVVFDGYDNPRLPGINTATGHSIREFFPYREQGSILITTRSPRITFAKQLRLNKLVDHQGLMILATRSGRIVDRGEWS